MAREILDPAAFVGQARLAVIELENQKETLQGLTAEQKKLEKELSGERKVVADEIAATVKKRRDELEETYNSQIRTQQDKLRQEKNKRAKAKEKGVRSRMEEETASLVAENTGLRTQIRELFSQKGVPSFCNNTFFYSLYFPSGLKELLILLLTVLVWCGGIPLLIWRGIAERKPLHLVLLILVFLIVFVGIYILIGNLTKTRHYNDLREGRNIRNQIARNKRRIQKIRKGIRKDKNEDVYDLGEFDAAITGIEGEIAGLQKKKEDALNLFEQETDPMIRQEIQENNRERLTALENSLAETTRAREEAEKQVRERTITCSEEYEAVIGKEYMTPDKLDGILNVFETEHPTNLTEAVQIYRASGKK